MLLARLRRRGLASLELVLSLPFLLAVAVISASLAKVGLAKSSASIEARADAWRQRATVGGSKPSLTALDFNAATSGTVSGQGSSSVRMAPVLAPSGVTAESRHQVLAGTWDYRILKPGAGQLQVDPLMLSFAGGGAAQELAAILHSINEGQIQGVSAIREAVESFRDVLADLKKLQEIAHKLVKALKPGSSGGSSGGGVLGQLANALGGAGGAATGVAQAIKLIPELWDAARKLVADSTRLGQKLPGLVQAVGQLPLTSIGGRSLPKGQDLPGLLQERLQKLALQQLRNQLGANWSIDQIKAVVEKLENWQKELKQAVDDFQKVADFIDGLGSGELFRYANF